MKIGPLDVGKLPKSPKHPAAIPSLESVGGAEQELSSARYKLTNRVVQGCGLDLFSESYDTQTRCIKGDLVDRRSWAKMA